MNQDKAKKIFLQALPELSEPLKSAVEFTLANWYKLKREPRPSDVAINFFTNLPALPTNDVDDVFAAKLNAMAKILRDDPDVWLSIENLPHEQWHDVIGYKGLYPVSNYGRVKSFHNNDLPQLLRINPNKSGYATVALSKNNKIKSVNYNRKLTPQEVIYIRKNYIPCHPEFGVKPMAKKFNVHKTTISDIIHYVTYKDISSNLPRKRLRNEHHNRSGN